MAGKDINITIGAEDQASEILKKVEQSTEQLTKSVDRMSTVSAGATKAFSVGFKGLLGVTAGIGAAVVAIKGITAAISGMAPSVDAFNTQEEAARGMTQAQLDFAAALQVATNAGDESTLALMRQAEAMGFAKENSDELVTVALGLSEAFGISQDEALKKAAQAVNGNANALAELLPGMRQIDEAAKSGAGAFAGLTAEQSKNLAEQQKLAIISEAAGGGLSKLQEDAQSTRGVMERSAGAFGDLQEKIGALFEPIFRVTHMGFAVFAETLQTTLGPAIDAVRSGFDSMGPVFEVLTNGFRRAAVIVGVAVEAIVNVTGSLASSVLGIFGTVGGSAMGLSGFFRMMSEGIIGAITFVEVVLSNLPTVWEMAVKTIALRIEQIRADIEHVFTQVIPAYLNWFGENALNLLQDYFNLYVTIVTNFGKKLGSFFSTLFSFISSGFEGGLSGLTQQLGEAMAGSLVEGFEAKTQPLPDIASRELTGAEQALADDLARMGTELGDEFQTKFDERVKGLDFETSAAVNLDVPNLEDISNLGEEIDKAVKVQIQPLQAQEERLLNRGANEDPNKMVAENTKKTNEKLDKLPEQIATQLAPLIGGDPNMIQFVEVA